ncbi:hypothetical protein SE17_41565, partial [Kouleothrix aurantiaca]
MTRSEAARVAALARWGKYTPPARGSVINPRTVTGSSRGDGGRLPIRPEQAALRQRLPRPGRDTPAGGQRVQRVQVDAELLAHRHA